VNVWLPDRVAGGPYNIEVENQPTDNGQPARATIVAEAQAVDAKATLSVRTGVPVANRTVVGGPLVITHRDADGDGTRELVVNDSRGLAPKPPDSEYVAHTEIVYVNASTGELSSVAPDGSVTGYGVSAAAVGPKQIDFDGDGLVEVPYVTNSNELRLIDEEGEMQTLASDAAKSPQQNSYGTVVTIGTWRGNLSLFYMNKSDTGDNDEANIYRVTLDGETKKVIANESGVETNAIAGIGDVNDDGDTDLAFVGLSQRIRYVDDDSVTDTLEDVGYDKGIGIGAPRQFDTGEVERVPFVYSNNVKLLSYAGGSSSVTALTGNDEAAQTFVTGVDWVGDDTQEVVFVAGANETIRYVTLNGTTGAITDSDNNTITVDESAGTA
jgi:hypothetical protein